MLVDVAKYDPLFEHLCRAEDGPVEMTFTDIESLVGPLLASAIRHAAWWANEAEGGRHVQAKGVDERRSAGRRRQTVLWSRAVP